LTAPGQCTANPGALTSTFPRTAEAEYENLRFV
jgi:hypothetical protein